MAKNSGVSVGGYLFLAQPPLYLCSKGNVKEYCYSDDQKRLFIEKYANGNEKDVKVQRYKGLGEMDAQQLWDTTMNPETRTLKQVSIREAQVADHIFSMLMGDDVGPRRDFIEQNAKYAEIDA